MKKCRKCGEYLHKSRFSKDPQNKDGLKNRCKKCDAKYWKEYKGYFNSDVEINENVGGYKIYILNYAKKSEFKYNIVSTNGNVWNFASKNLFLDKLKELLNVA